MIRGHGRTAFREQRSCVCNDIQSDQIAAPWKNEAGKRGFRASASFPIRLKGEVSGTLNVYAFEAGFFKDKEVALLEEAAIDISYALDNLIREADRRAAEERLQAEQRFSDTMINSLPGTLYFFDSTGRFLRWNHTFEQVSGYSSDEVAVMQPLDFFAPEDQPLLQTRITEVFERGESSVEAPLLTKDGRLLPYLFTGKHLEYDGRPCLVGFGIDISDQKIAEQRLRELNESLERKVADRTEELQAALIRAESADKLKSAFLATMSHELRTPLNSIIGFTGILLQQLAGPINAEQTRQLGMVRSSARHLLELINDVLDISKIEAGQLEIRQTTFDLRSSVERVTASVRPMAAAKGLSLAAEIDPVLTQVIGDQRRVDQILLNLLNNAIKFTEHGSVILKAEMTESLRLSSGQGTLPAVRLSVTDTGIGIQEQDIDTLFHPFQQLDNGLTRLHEGTGLGLAICKRLTDLMDGEISVASQPGHGSTFTVTLPLHPPPRAS